MTTTDQLAVESFNLGLKYGRELERAAIVDSFVATQMKVNDSLWKWDGTEWVINLGTIITIIEGEPNA
jgi:hypothetical protein